MQQYILAADGACSGNPGPGGYAWVITENQEGRFILLANGDGLDETTTNNIMELSAAHDGLAHFLRKNLDPGEIKLKLDSQYVLKGIFEWMPVWKGRGWKAANKKPVKNRALWERVDANIIELITRGFTLEPNWVRGHSGDPDNEAVDNRAVWMRMAAERAAMVNGL